jgi:uncharacterized Zn-binding protein involved in type VI secretion
MQMTETLTYDADPAAVFAMLCDRGWRERVSESIHAKQYEVSIEPSGDSVTVTTSRTMPAMVPDMVRKMTGETITIVQVERWGPPAADGARTADLEVTIAGQPAGMQGSARLSPTATGSTEVFSGDVTVRVPFLGKRIEPEVVKAFRAFIRKEGEIGRAHLAAG